MKKYFILITVLFLGVSFIYAQATESPLQEMDGAVKLLTENLNKKLSEENARKIALGQFTYRDFIAPFGTYWVNQLSEELVNIPDRSFIILSDGGSGAEWTISGEIAEVADIIRVYTRLIRVDNRAIEAAFHSDFIRNEYTEGMLYYYDSGSSGSSSYFPRDIWEPDSIDNPVPCEIGENENAPVMRRTIHNRDDQDFFLLVPAIDGRLVVETTGDIDTYMEFYDADTQEKLAQNDDGGSGYNARIRHSVRAGNRYIAKVRGYGSDDLGNYGFRAYLLTSTGLAPDEYEVDDEPSQAKFISIGTPQQHTFHTEDDVDWVKFQIERPGRYVIRTRGVVSNNLDTYIELFDENLDSIAENDDGGEEYDSRLSLRLNSGLYYLKVRCLDSEAEEPYIINIDAE